MCRQLWLEPPMAKKKIAAKKSFSRRQQQTSGSNSSKILRILNFSKSRKNYFKQLSRFSFIFLTSSAAMQLRVLERKWKRWVMGPSALFIRRQSFRHADQSSAANGCAGALSQWQHCRRRSDNAKKLAATNKR